MRRVRVKVSKMSSSSESEDDAKVYKLRSRSYFPIWKQKTLSMASSRGFEKYLSTSVPVNTEAEIDAKMAAYINETDDGARRVLKGELSQMKRARKKSLEAANMLTNSVRSKDLKMLANCKSDPKKMFDKICKKYGSEEDTDLSDLLDDFNECGLKTKKMDPEDWYAELDQINEQLEGIDTSFKKSEKEVAAHILNSLPRGYKSVKTIIQMDDNYLDDLSKVKKQITKHWKTSFRKKARKGKYDSSSESSSSDSSEESRKHRKGKKKGDEYALNVETPKQDTRNQYGVIVCGHCGKPGHGMATCWDLHGRPPRFNQNGQGNGNGNGAFGRGVRRCWNCGATDHIQSQCPHANNNNGNNQNEDDQINSLFIGMMLACKVKGADKMRKCRCNGQIHTSVRCPPMQKKEEYNEYEGYASDNETTSSNSTDETNEHKRIEEFITTPQVDQLVSKMTSAFSDVINGYVFNDESEDESMRVSDELSTIIGDVNTAWNEVEDSSISSVEEWYDTIDDTYDEDNKTSLRPYYNRNYEAEEELKKILGMKNSNSNEEIYPIYTNLELNLLDDNDEWETWLGDTGASCHVTSHATSMNNLKSNTSDVIIVGDKRKCAVKEKGNLEVLAEDNDNSINLSNVRVVEEIGKNIVSIGLLLLDGGNMEGTNSCIIVKYKGAIITFMRNSIDGLYYTKLKRLNEPLVNNINEEQCWTIVNNDKKKWPKMSREEAHRKWGHPHLDQMNKMAQRLEINLQGKLPKCAGCALVKSRAARTVKTSNRKATEKGERLFIDTTGPYPKSRGGMKYWMCCVDDFSDKTWTYFAPSKNYMIKFVKEMVTLINGLKLQVRYICCDNAGEHQSELQKYCVENGITLEYTAPNTPQQNGRAEKKIHILWQRAMTMMVTANLKVESQNKFWAEAVSTANYLEDLVIKAQRDKPALECWTDKSVSKWVKRLVEFGRIGVANKKDKLIGKMKMKGFTIVMVGYAMNHGPGTYRVYNPSSNRIIITRDVEWSGFKPRKLEAEFSIFEPGITSETKIEEVENRENSDDDSTISTNENNKPEINDNELFESSSESDTDSTSTVTKHKKKRNDLTFSSSDISYSSSSESSKHNTSSSSSNSESQAVSQVSRPSLISKPIAHRTRSSSRGSLKIKSKRKSNIPVPSVTVRRSKRLEKLAKSPDRTAKHKKKSSVSSQRTTSNKRKSTRVKKVTGDTVARRVRIFESQDEGEEVNTLSHLACEYDDDNEARSEYELFYLSEATCDRLYQGLPSDDEVMLQIYTMELMSDPETPTTLKKALSGKDKEIWRKSATAKVNNFLKRKSWKFILKSVVQALGRKPIGVKWVFKIKNEPDYSLRYKSRVVTKGYMQIPGVDYSEKFSPVAQPSTVKTVLAMVLWLFWKCELVDIEAAFLEGRLKQKAYIDLPEGLVELGFMTQDEYDKSCIELQGGMYGNVDAALLYFVRFTDYATSPDGLDLQQSKSDPCLFFKKDNEGKTLGVIVIYVDDCLIAGEDDFISDMKTKLKSEFGVVEDGQLRKLLGVRYQWDDLECPTKARVTLNMDDKAKEIIQAYQKATGKTPKSYKTPGKPGEILVKHDGDPVMHSEYRSILGKLMFYVTKISPECSYACGQLARQMHRPGEAHWEAMHRLIGYLIGKEHHNLVIRRPTSLKIVSFGDASYGDCRDTRHSSTGDLHTIGGSIISWRAQKTKFVCLSSAEAEYVALNEMCKEQKFLSMLMEEVFECNLPCVLYEDNQAAVYLAKNKHVSARTKHIDIRKHYVREHLKETGRIEPIRSEDNFADLLTKNVAVNVFEILGPAVLNGFNGFEDKFRFPKHQRENV